MKTKERIVTVFGSSRPQPDEPGYQTAYELGKELAEAGFTLCNGGYGGVMEASARGAHDVHGKTYGILVESFRSEPNAWISTPIVEKTLIDRLMKLVGMGTAYVILPGGTGTLLELATVWELMNKGMLEHKPCVSVGTFWNPVLTTMKRQLEIEGRHESSMLMKEVSRPGECVEYLLHRFGKEKS